MRKLSIDHTEVSQLPAGELIDLEELKIQHSNIHIFDIRHLRNMRRVEMSMTQHIFIPKLVSCRFDEGDVEFLSSAVTPDYSEYDTSRYYNMPVVSLGAPSYVEIGDNIVLLASGALLHYNTFNCQNLVFCKYLNLRNTDVNSIMVKYLLFLQYIDISFSKIVIIDFMPCK